MALLVFIHIYEYTVKFKKMDESLVNRVREAVKKALLAPTPKGQFLQNTNVKPEVVAEKAKDKEGLMYAIATNIAKYGKPQTPKGAKPAHLTKGQMIKKEKAVMGLKKSLEENKEHYMFFQNLKTIKQMVDKMLALDANAVDNILTNGHDWAADHIATSKDDVEEVHNFLMSHKSPIEIDEKELSPKQQKIAKMAPPADKITGADFAALRANKK